jgi:hypothetical protein
LLTCSIRRFRRTILSATLALLLVACGMDSHGVATRPPPIAPSSASGATATASTAGNPSSASGRTVTHTITNADNGATVQVAVGDDVSLALRVPPGADPWQVQQPDPQVLAPIPNPAAAAVGVTLRAFRAASPGQATIAAESRPHCDAGGACPGAIQGFRVTVVVAAP